MIRVRAWIIAVFLAIGGCAATPPAPALLAPSEQACHSAFELEGVEELEAPEPGRRSRHSAALRSTAACWLDPEHAEGTPYHVVALPDPFDGKSLLTVAARHAAAETFALEVRLLDEQGIEVRRLERGRYNMTGLGYSIQTRVRDRERFVVVSADPALVGVGHEHITLGVNSAYVSGGAYGATVTVGAEDSASRTFSYRGDVLFQITALP